jgi:hypothetical protein
MNSSSNAVVNAGRSHSLNGSSVTILNSGISGEDFVICMPSTKKRKGKQYAFKALSTRLRDEWVDAIGSLILRSRMRPKGETDQKSSRVLRIQNKMRAITFADDFQALVGFMVFSLFSFNTQCFHDGCCNQMQIFLNFVLNIVESQMLPVEGSTGFSVMSGLNMFFTIVFTCELLLKLFATWLRDFVIEPWNWFDLVVITLSWAIFLLGTEGQGLVFIRILRALRVAGLIRRIKVLSPSMRHSAPPLPPLQCSWKYHTHRLQARSCRQHNLHTHLLASMTF